MVSVFERLTSLNLQGRSVEDKCVRYSDEIQRQYTTSLDSFVLRGKSNRELIQKVRKREAGIERDLFKSTNLEAACLAAKVSSRDQCESIDRRIMSYNSLVCMDFQGPTGLDAIKDKLRELPYVYYAGVSSGATGVFSIIPVANADWQKHEVYFDALEEITRDMGLNPTKKGREVTGLRYESWDDEFYLNRHCEWFSLDSL